MSTLSLSITRAFSTSSSKDDGSWSSSTSTSHNYGETQRKLIKMFVENLDPIAGIKINWYKEQRFTPLGVNIRSKPEAQVARGKT